MEFINKFIYLKMYDFTLDYVSVFVIKDYLLTWTVVVVRAG